MNERNQLLTRFLLEFLGRLDGGQAVEPVIHAQLNLKMGAPRPTMAEVDGVLRDCEARRWIVGVRGPLGDPRWSLTPAGEAALSSL
ncbi:MAG: hypothetical protein ACYDC1_25065 [Limisphaerales bacterium]